MIIPRTHGHTAGLPKLFRNAFEKTSRKTASKRGADYTDVQEIHTTGRTPEAFCRYFCILMQVPGAFRRGHVQGTRFAGDTGREQ